MDLYTIRQSLLRGVSIYDMPLNVVFYSRVSTDTDEQLHSLTNQINYFKDYIESKPKWTMTDYYVDEGLSGINTAKRESFNRMIQDAHMKKFDLLLAKEVSRFARNTLDSIFFTRQLLNDGVGVFFINDNINTVEPDSELRLTIMASMAQDESRKISSRVRFGYQRSIKDGVVLGNDNIWGYKKEKGKLVIVPEEAEIVKKIYEYYSMGNGFRKIALMLIDEGYVCSTGRPFGTTTLKRVLTNQKYKGYYCGNKVSKIDIFSNKQHIKDEKDWTVWKDDSGDTVPAIISEELWVKCSEIMKEKNEKFSKSQGGYSSRYSYSEKLKCGLCGNTFWRTLYYKGAPDEQEAWTCKTYQKLGTSACKAPTVYTKDLNYVLQQELEKLSKDSDVKEELDFLFQRLAVPIDNTDKIKALEQEIDNVMRKKDKLLELSMDGALPNSEFKKRNDIFTLSLDKLEEEIEDLKRAQIETVDKKKKLDKIKSSFQKIFDFNSELSAETISNFVDMITITKDDSYIGKGSKIDLEIKLKIGLTIKKSYLKFQRRTSDTIQILDEDKNSIIDISM